MTTATYTTRLQAGLGMLDETRELLELWQPGDTTTDLYQRSLESGRFPTLSARRLRNVVAECFAPRFLANGAAPASLVRSIRGSITSSEFRQLCLIFTCRANEIASDFIQGVYWESYASGRTSISKEQARHFVDDANRDGHTSLPWSETTRKRVAGYLTGTLADFGLLEPAVRGERAPTTSMSKTSLTRRSLVQLSGLSSGWTGAMSWSS